MGVRHGFGFWLQPISQANNWTRETYSLAMALQNLMWGVFGPFAGMAADRFGTARVAIFGALLYAAGLLWMATVTHPVTVRRRLRHADRRRAVLHRIRRDERHYRTDCAGNESGRGHSAFPARPVPSASSR